MYHKDLDQDKIIAETLEMMKDAGPGAVSFRAIARSLGCAHTNIYNFFKDSESLFRICGLNILHNLDQKFVENLKHSTSKKERLKSLYSTYIHFYLDYPGWFQLLWTYPMQLNENAESKTALMNSIQNSVQRFGDNLQHCRTVAQAHHLLHIVHAYLLGEVSIFLAGKSLFKDRKSLTTYVVDRCVQLTTLLDTESTNKLPHFLK